MSDIELIFFIKWYVIIRVLQILYIKLLQQIWFQLVNIPSMFCHTIHIFFLKDEVEDGVLHSKLVKCMHKFLIKIPQKKNQESRG